MRQVRAPDCLLTSWTSIRECVLCEPWRRRQCLLVCSCFESAFNGGSLCCCCCCCCCAGAGGLQAARWNVTDSRGSECHDNEASLFTLLASERCWKDTSMWKLLPHSLARFGCSAAPASHTAFGDHSVDYQQDSKCLSLYRPWKGFWRGYIGTVLKNIPLKRVLWLARYQLPSFVQLRNLNALPNHSTGSKLVL